MRTTCYGQVLAWACMRRWSATWYGIRMRPALVSIVVSAPIPVSYTHLDVYKRQGDELRIRFQNLLADVQRVDGKAICEGSGGGGAEAGAGAETEGAVEEQRHFTVPQPPDDPCTRRAGIAIVGMTPLDGGDPLQTGLREPLPGDPVIEYRFRAGKAGSHFFSSLLSLIHI